MCACARVNIMCIITVHCRASNQMSVRILRRGADGGGCVPNQSLYQDCSDRAAAASENGMRECEQCQ